MLLPKTLSEPTIRTLNKLRYKLYDVDIHTLTEPEFTANKATIETILRPNKKGYVTKPYVTAVSEAYAYAKSHYWDRAKKRSLLSDIVGDQATEKTDPLQYKY